MSSTTIPYLEISTGGSEHGGGAFILTINLKNVGLGPAFLKRIILAGEQLTIANRSISPGSTERMKADISGNKILTEETIGGQLIVEYGDIHEQKLHTSRADIIQEKRADGRFNISIANSHKDPSRSKAEAKRQLVRELRDVHQRVTSAQLAHLPAQPNLKEWAINAEAIFKQIDQTDHDQFVRLKDNLTAAQNESAKQGAAEKIYDFMQRKIAEYERYDFSDLDARPEAHQGSGAQPFLQNIIHGNVHSLNQAQQQTFEKQEMKSAVNSSASSSWRMQLGVGIVIAVVTGLVALAVAYFKHWFGLGIE